MPPWKAGVSFVASDRAISLAVAAETFGQSPARDYLLITDPMLVALVDEALAARLLTLRESKNQPPPGLDYASNADYDDAGEVARVRRDARSESDV